MRKREIRVIEGVEYLQCSKCKEFKDVNGFTKGGGKYKDGTQKYTSQCRECINKNLNKHRRAKGVKEKKREVKIIDGIKYLQCSKCKEWKDVNGFDKGGEI